MSKAHTSRELETRPVQANTLRVGGLAMLQGHPCKISTISRSQPGKHGHAKLKFVGKDIFTAKKVDDSTSCKDTMQVPVTTRSEMQLVNIDSDGFMSVLGDDGTLHSDYRLPEDKVGAKIQKGFDNGEELLVTFLCAGSQRTLVSSKVDTTAGGS